MRQLSVRQLKLILQRNCINYKGCVEKRELCDKVVTLWRAREEEKVRQATIAQTGNIGEREQGSFLYTVVLPDHVYVDYVDVDPLPILCPASKRHSADVVYVDVDPLPIF